MNALVVGACPVTGSAGLYRRLAGSADVVIAADAAGEWCVDAGRDPDVALGDFDSSQPGAADRLAAQGIRIIAFPAEKDASDLDLCVQEALRLGATAIDLTACTAGRLDHALAALGTLCSIPCGSGRIIEPAMRVHVLDASATHELRLSVIPGSIVSVMAVGPASGVSLSGLRYPLHEAPLDLLSSLALSNVALEPEITVTAATGTLLVIIGQPE